MDYHVIPVAEFNNPEKLFKKGQLVKDENNILDLQPQRPKPDLKKLWFPTTETCQDNIV